MKECSPGAGPEPHAVTRERSLAFVGLAFMDLFRGEISSDFGDWGLQNRRWYELVRMHS